MELHSNRQRRPRWGTGKVPNPNAFLPMGYTEAKDKIGGTSAMKPGTIPVLHGAGFLLALVAGYIMAANEDPRALFSVRCSVGAMTLLLTIAVPLSFGFGAADAVRLLRSKDPSLARSLPSNTLVKTATTRIVFVASGGVVGLFVGLSVAIGIGMANGSRFTVAALVQVPVQAVVIFAATGIGWILGVSLRSWLVPPLVAAAAYSIYAFVYGLALWPDQTPFVEVMGGFPPTLAYSHPTPIPYLLTIAFYLCLFGVAIAGVLMWAKVSPSAKASPSAIAAFCVALSATCVSYVALHVAIPSLGQPLENGPAIGYEYDKRDDWLCSPLDSDLGTVCMPPERPQDLRALQSAITTLATRWAALDPNIAGKTWVPYTDNDASTLGYDLPLGQPYDMHTHAFTIAASIMGQCNELPFGSPHFFAAMDARATIITWLDPDYPKGGMGQDEVPSYAQARRAYAVISLCR